MAKPAKSAAQKKKELIDDQEYVSQKEKEAAKAKIDEKEKQKKAAAQAKANKEADLPSAKDSTKLNTQKNSAVEQAKKNKEADLPSAKDSVKLSKVPSREESSSGKVSPAKKSNLGTSKQAASDLIAKAAGAEEGIRKIEAAKTEKAATQARKNKEKDLPGFDGHAAQKAYQQKVEQEKIEYLDTKEARDKKYSLEQELAELKAQAKAETEKAGTVQIVASGRKGANASFVLPETQKRIDELEKEISDLNKNITLASRAQEKKYLYNRASGAEDFSEYSKEPQKEEPAAVRPHQQNIGRETETLKGYMTDEERAVYNYYFNKFGEEKAEEFFESIEEDLNFRQAQAIFAGNEGKVFNEYIQGAVAGLEDAKEGYKGTLNMLLGIDEEQPTSTYDFLSGMAREDLGKSGIKLPEVLGGASLGQIGFDVVNTTANMLPSIMLGTLGGSAVGAVGIGASAAGNAYNEAIKAGYDKEQATNYAALVGASEASLGYLLGGIEATGGKLGKAAMAKVLPKIDNALAKVAVNVGGKMLSEFSEEYLQEVLSPVFENIALMEENEIDLLSPEAIYAGILGGLSAAGIAVFDGSANVPEVFEKAEVPVPFEGKAQPGTEAALVADKITEIENRPISEAEKAAKMEEVMQAVAGTTGTAEVIAEAEKFKNIHEQRVNEGYNLSENDMQEYLKTGGRLNKSKLKALEEGKKILLTSKAEVKDYIKNALTNARDLVTAAYGKVSNRLAQDVFAYSDGNVDVKNSFLELVPYDIQHAYENHIQAKKKGDIELTFEDFENIPEYINNYDNLVYVMKYGTGSTHVCVSKKISGGRVVLIETVSKSRNSLQFKNIIGVSEDKYIKRYEKLYKKRNMPNSGGSKSFNTSPPDGRVSNNIISPVDGKSNPPSIGNDVFGAGIFGNRNSETTPQEKSDEEFYAEILGLEDTVPSFVRADINRIVNDPSITNEQKFYDLMALYDSAKTPAEKSEIGRYIYQMKTMPTERKPFFGIKNKASSSAKSDAEQNATFVQERGIETPEGMNLLQEEVETNIGSMPVEDYREILAVQNGFDSYEQMQAEARAMEEWDRKEEWHKEQAEAQMKEIIREGHSRRFVREETKAEPGTSEFVSAEIATEAKTPSMERANKNLNVQDWKNLAEGIAPEFLKIWAMKDFSRFLDSAAGGNKVLRQQLFELYEKPLNEAQGNYARNYAEKAKSISEKFKELGIKAGSKESAAVQRIGEGVKEIDKRGNTVPYTLNDLKTDFPDSWENIKAGADYCREIYDEFLHDLNEMYSEIYPATVEEANARVSGYNDRIKNDREYIDRYNEAIGKLEEQKTAKQAELSRKRPNSLIYAELQNQITNIDRRIEIANRRIERIENRKLTKEISRDTLQAQIENGEILKNKQIKPRKDYFRHFQELTDEFAEIADIFSNDQRIPPNLAGKSETTKPRTIWTSIAQSRSNNNYYTEDAVGGLLRYTEIAEKLLVFDPLISHFRDVNSAIRAAGVMADNEVKKKGTNAGQFARHMDGVTNQLAGKTNPILDRAIADWGGGLGRATMKAVEALNRRVKSNAILGNVRSALVQIGNLPNAALYIQNPVDWTMGAISLTNSTPEIIEARSKSNFMNRRYMGDTIDALTKEIQDNNILDKLKEFALWMLGAGDKAAAELIWHTAYSRAVRNPKVLSSGKGLRGYENAVDYADDITRRSIGGRAEGDIPLAEESKIIGLVAPFQIEVTNTFNAFTEQIGKKNAAGIIGFEIGVWLINTVLEGIIGDRPLGLDYIDAIWDIVAEAIGDDEEEEKDFWDIVTYAGGRIAGETLSGMPLGAQIGDLITGGDEQKAEDWFGDNDPTRYGTGNIGMGAFADAVDYFREGETPEKFYDLITDGKKNSYSEWAKPVLDTVDTFAPLVMPWGGKQLSRTLGGLDQIIQGGAYGMENDGSEYLKFPQEYDPESIIKTVLFGQYASDRGQNYIDSGFKDKLSAEQTEQMELAEEYGLSKQEFYDVILGLKPYSKKEDKQKALLDNQDLDAGTKEIIDMILFGKPSVKAAENGYVEPTRSYASTKDFYLSGLSEGDRRLAEQDFSDGEIKKINNAINKGENKGESIANIQKAMDCTEAEAYEIYSRREGTWVEELSGEDLARADGAEDFYGMSTDDYLAVLNYSEFGTVVTDENGEESYSTKMEDVIPKIMEVTGWDEETAKKNYLMVNKYEYGRKDLEEERVSELDTSQNWYEVEDKGYFVARNVIKTVEGTKDEYGNTIDGSFKEAAVKEIAKQLGIDETEATIYYLAANGDLVLSEDDMETTQIEDMKEAIENGWTERQFIDAMNVIKVSGASKKEEILKALQDAGATYEMAQGYYNLKENADYDRFVGKVTYKYGVQKKKQEVKCDYFLKNYNGDGSLTAKDMANWFAAGAGCKKKQEYIDAYMSAGATYSQALKFYNLMRGHDDDFNAWYKENGG